MYKIGTDPEMFLKNANGYVSAHGLFPGTKEEPFKLDKGAVQVDGLALEFNIDAADTETEFVTNIGTVMAQVRDMVAKVDKDLEIEFTPFARFDPKYFEESIPDEAKILGCTPDMNITGVVNNPPTIGDRPFRTAAGHVHIGWDKDLDVDSIAHFEDCKFVANHFYREWHNGRMVVQPGSPRTADEHERLKYYGYSGAYRMKPYGIELRQPSNLWLRTPEAQGEMYRFVISQMKRLEEVS